MAYVKKDTARFYGETFKASDPQGAAYVAVNRVRHDLLPNALSALKSCSNAKEYAERAEALAYLIFIKKSLSNDGYFNE